MSIKRPARARRGAPCTAWLWAKLNDRPVPAECSPFERFCYLYPDATRRDRLRTAWHDHGAQVLEAWIVEKPESRPSCWWLFDAPEPLPAGESQPDYLRRHNLIQTGEKT